MPTPPMTFEVYVAVLNGPSADPPKHSMRMGGVPEVYVEIRRAEQETCTHHFDPADRFGDTFCVSCGATAWSAWWVRAGLYGENTHRWMVSMDHRWRDLAEAGGLQAVQSTLGATVIAHIDPDEPARLVGTKGSVPAMDRRK